MMTSSISGTAAQNEGKFTENFDDLGAHGHAEPESSLAGPQQSPVQRKESLSKKLSIRRAVSKRSADSHLVNLDEDSKNINSVFVIPVPTQANPTEILAERFNVWRRLIKDYVAYFKEVAASYEARSKSSSKLLGALSGIVETDVLMQSGGILDTKSVLERHHNDSQVAEDAARRVQLEVIQHLNAVRNDLGSKVKEIKALASDFKNSVDKEKENTRKAVIHYLEAISALNNNSASRVDPYIAKLAVDEQVKRQLAEENYLHRAYLNLESSGRELESVIVKELQKAFKTYANIIVSGGEALLNFAADLNRTTLQLPPDREWSHFIDRDPNFVASNIPLRSVEHIEYPHFQHPAASVVREGHLERKSKYLKSYTAGWFVLTPTHLHEFKTPNRDSDPNPIMSLYLPDSSLGSHSNPFAKSHKFVLRGRQTGALHRGHSWVFRAASHETLLEWFNDIKQLTDPSDTQKDASVGLYTKSDTVNPDEPSQREGSFSGDENGLDNDEADEVPYSAESVTAKSPSATGIPVRPEGGRFPSEMNLHHDATRDRDGLIEEAATGTCETQPDNNEVWAYDKEHPVNSTYRGDQSFAPVQADVPPELERQLSQKHVIEALSEPADHRRDSGAYVRKVPSRKPTSSYGIDPITGQPDEGATGLDLAQVDWSQLIEGHTGPAQIQPSSQRKVPSRKPTASYGFDPVANTEATSGPVTGLVTAPIALDDLEHPYDATDPGTNTTPMMFFEQNNPAMNHAQDPAFQEMPDRPSLKDSKQSTLQDIHVPGEYPKDQKS